MGLRASAGGLTPAQRRRVRWRMPFQRREPLPDSRTGGSHRAQDPIPGGCRTPPAATRTAGAKGTAHGPDRVSDGGVTNRDRYDHPDVDPEPPPEPERSPPRWTTGQGIGLLVMLPRWAITVAGIVAMLVAGWRLTDSHLSEIVFFAGAGAAVLGLLWALPGWIVFTMCKTRRPR